MIHSRPTFFRQSGAAPGAIEMGTPLSAQDRGADAFEHLKNLTAGIPRLARTDFELRLERARELMTEQKVARLYLNSGATMEYFGGIRWDLSERMFAMLIRCARA